MVTSTARVEVRLITYRRPDLLRRALSGLQAQSHAYWQAVVFDDSPDQEGRAVVQKLADVRIHYRPNLDNLGMVRNTSQAFSPQPFLPDSQFACVLEDDNQFDPTLLAANTQALHLHPHAVLARNYRMVDVQEDGTEAPTTVEPMRSRWGGTPREISFEERVKEAFFTFTLGHLGYFWRLNVGIDLAITSETLHGPVSEVSRAVAFSSSCWYEPLALASFSRFVNKRQTPRSETPASTRHRRQAKISEIEFTRRLMKTWCHDLHQNMRDILPEAKRRPAGAEALQRLAEAGYWPAWRYLSGRKAVTAAMKTQILRWRPRCLS